MDYYERNELKTHDKGGTVMKIFVTGVGGQLGHDVMKEIEKRGYCDEEISTHAAGGDAMVIVLEGKGRFTVGREKFILEAGETLIMPKDVPHTVYGEEKFKMLLVVSF